MVEALNTKIGDLRWVVENDTSFLTFSIVPHLLLELVSTYQSLNSEYYTYEFWFFEPGFSTQLSASALEQRHLQEDHDRLMTRHSALLQEMAAKVFMIMSQGEYDLKYQLKIVNS